MSDPGCLWISEKVKDAVAGLNLKEAWVGERKSNLWCRHHMLRKQDLTKSFKPEYGPRTASQWGALDMLVRDRMIILSLR